MVHPTTATLTAKPTQPNSKSNFSGGAERLEPFPHLILLTRLKRKAEELRQYTRHASPRNVRRGFTLIELLMVIAI
ncbi:MAG: prepilin-type N-terminal cleavage/methylation domain-containing protein, partial [Armatimonadetes bacterium]|nr:prepilin-type N-terminal cleavage/methylation domain-containing protein [Armatimonadota bacterium]